MDVVSAEVMSGLPPGTVKEVATSRLSDLTSCFRAVSRIMHTIVCNPGASALHTSNRSYGVADDACPGLHVVERRVVAERRRILSWSSTICGAYRAHRVCEACTRI